MAHACFHDDALARNDVPFGVVREQHTASRDDPRFMIMLVNVHADRLANRNHARPSIVLVAEHMRDIHCPVRRRRHAFVDSIEDGLVVIHWRYFTPKARAGGCFPGRMAYHHPIVAPAMKATQAMTYITSSYHWSGVSVICLTAKA